MTVDPYSPHDPTVESARQPVDAPRWRKIGPLVFWLAHLLVIWAAAAVAVYAFGFIEREFGHGGSFLLMAGIGAAFSLAATFGFASAAALTHRFSGPRESAILGLIAAAITVASLYLHAKAFGPPTPLTFALLWTAGIGALSALSSPRAVA